MARARCKCGSVMTCAVGPHATTSRASSSVCGKTCRTCASSCTTAMTVRCWVCHSCSKPSSAAVVWASTALNGSSSKISCASCTSSRANSTRCNWPDDSVLMGRWSKSLKPTACSAHCTCASCALHSPPHAPTVAQQPSCTHSPTRSGKLRSISDSCGKYATRARCVATVSCPPSAGTSPIMLLSSVVLPDPLGPTTAVSEPGANWPLMWCSAGCWR